MPYCTLSDIEKLIPQDTIIQLTDDEDTGSVNQARVDEAIAQADSIIDSYCGTRYSVPFSTVPDIVKTLSVDIAIYNLYSRRVEEIPETRDQRYRNAIRQLEGIARGTISIGEDPEPAVHSEGGSESNKTTNDRIFTRDKLEGF